MRVCVCACAAARVEVDQIDQIFYQAAIFASYKILEIKTFPMALLRCVSMCVLALDHELPEQTSEMITL